MDINSHINKINKDGITVIKNIFSKRKCDDYVKQCEILFDKLLKKKK